MGYSGLRLGLGFVLFRVLGFLGFAQRAQYPLIKEYSLNPNMKPVYSLIKVIGLSGWGLRV